MQYPRPLMSITELHNEMALPIRSLKEAAHVPGQKFARKTTGGGKWLFETAEYEKFRMRRTS